MGAGNRAFMETQKQGPNIETALAALTTMDGVTIPGILSRLSTLETQAADHASHITTAETQITNHETRITTLEGA